ncbi:MAG TPA: HAD-IA family hydrolase [Ktedonobacteraceae bacterium]|nr:HAD-IA family hydrolase [Ktedonobacteraceae bacterium]
MKQRWALLLDLDQTLVFTEALQSLRDHRQWIEIHKYHHLTSLPGYTKAFLDRVRPHFELGVVTASPRRYAEGLVDYHGLNIKVLTAYHDTKQHKPDPDPLFHASKQLGILPARCVHIGDHAKDVAAASQAHMVSIALSWDGSLDLHAISKYSYTLCANWNEVITCLRGIITER